MQRAPPPQTSRPPAHSCGNAAVCLSLEQVPYITCTISSIPQDKGTGDCLWYVHKRQVYRDVSHYYAHKPVVNVLQSEI